jgi:hypothetical protein
MATRSCFPKRNHRANSTNADCSLSGIAPPSSLAAKTIIELPQPFVQEPCGTKLTALETVLGEPAEVGFVSINSYFSEHTVDSPQRQQADLSALDNRSGNGF